jgi:hypothetical protein
MMRRMLAIAIVLTLTLSAPPLVAAPGAPIVKADRQGHVTT